MTRTNLLRPTGCAFISATPAQFIARPRSCSKKFRRHGLRFRGILTICGRESRMLTSRSSMAWCFLRQSSALQDPEVLLRLFHFVAHHDVRLSTTTEYKIEQVLPSLAATPPRGAELWLYLGEILDSAPCRPGAARHAFAAVVDSASSGIEGDRLAGGARFLSSLHGR